MEKIKFLNCKEILVLFKDLSKYNENMLNDVSENIKLYHKENYYGEIRVGYKWIHFEVKWLTMPYVEVKYKIKKNRFNKQEIEKLKSFSRVKVAVEPIFCHTFVYTRFLFPNVKEMSEIECSCCLDSKNADVDSYFKCGHRDICDECYYLLKNKICPICRSEC